MIDTKEYAAYSATTLSLPTASRRDPAQRTSRSISSTVASATPTCTPSAASGQGPSIRSYRVTKSSAGR